jgi:hypothetical protein
MAARRRLILNSRASTPFTTGIEAPWGAGKSSLMRQLKRHLEGEARRSKPGHWWQRAEAKACLRVRRRHDTGRTFGSTGRFQTPSCRLSGCVCITSASRAQGQLGHADLSTVSRYAHVAPEELHLAAEAIAGPQPPREAGEATRAACWPHLCGASEAGTAEQGDGRAPAPSGSRETAEGCTTPTVTNP